MILSKKINMILVGLLFVMCLGVGFRLASQKPLGNDELYTLVSSIHGQSYADILLGHIGEGNASPLFYLIQKGICDITRYEVPAEWLNGHWGFEDARSQILMRINPVVFMSLSIAMIFYYFSRYYSLWAGLYSIAVALSSFMIWVFWAEARPYALWVFLTSAQSFIFMRMITLKEGFQKGWIILTIVHLLLSLTIVLSLVQIAIVSLLLWIMWERDWKKYIMLLIVPAVLCVTYYLCAPKYQFWFADGPMALVSASIPKDRLLIIFVFAIYFCFVYLQPKVKYLGKFPIKGMSAQEKRGGGAYFWLTVLMVGSYFLLLLKLKLGIGLEKQGFQISNRYFIGLAPIGIMATTLFSIYLVKCSRHKIIQGIMVLSLAGLLIIRILRTIELV